MAKGNGKKQAATEVIHPGQSAAGMLIALGKDQFISHILKADRSDLNRYVHGLTGNVPHKDHPDEYVIKALSRWANGEKNWTYEPPKEGNPKPTNGHAHTREKETEMKTKAKAKLENGRKFRKSVSTPKAKSEKKVRSNHRKPDGTVMVHPWTERTRWFRSHLRIAKEKKWTDDQIMHMAVKEFGKDNVGSGPWTVAEQRKRLKK